MACKHLVIIHGRDKKPRCEEMKALVEKALIAGLQRVNEESADKIRNNSIKLSFVYYGDINNRLLVQRHCRLKYIMEEENGQWYVRRGYYDKDLETLIQRPTAEHTSEDYDKLVADQMGERLKDNAASMFSPVLSIFGMSNRAIKRFLPDLGSYLDSRVVGSEIRERLQCPLAKALRCDEDVMLLSHSMGCMVSYDVLWKFSRMSEYKELWNKKIKVWLTLGNPLGEPAVKEGLYDSDEPDDGRYPKNIEHWINISAVDDYISHDQTVRDDFRKMLHEKLVGAIDDLPPIYTFWKDQCGKFNAHNFFGYLNHPKVAEQVDRWIRSE
ncbi:hypothetical protein ACE3NQ_23570 [Paenibacillus terreus]|uniref:Uncharacterized protein n=1 Tax=Paenibacillus terreus TaxID=1387834 RepID=A0ABV5BEV4_9BACL